jgi:hypothetical protein
LKCLPILPRHLGKEFRFKTFTLDSLLFAERDANRLFFNSSMVAFVTLRKR